VVEVKVTVIERDEARALRTFRLARKDGEERRIFFYDTPKLDLYKKGVALRARECGDECESTVKIRPVDPKRVDPKWKKKTGFKVEADVVGSKVIRSASYSIAQKAGEIEEVASGERPIEKLFSGDQEEFLSEMAPARIDFGKLVSLGPVAATRWKFRNAGLPYDLCLEEWRLPDGRDVIEVSIKASQPEAAAAQAALGGFLVELGIEQETRAQTKTLTALQYFAAKSEPRRASTGH
jgi:hypothetical protein